MARGNRSKANGANVGYEAELDRYAAICCVQRVMRPYLEALAA